MIFTSPMLCLISGFKSWFWTLQNWICPDFTHFLVDIILLNFNGIPFCYSFSPLFRDSGCFYFNFVYSMYTRKRAHTPKGIHTKLYFWKYMFSLPFEAVFIQYLYVFCVNQHWSKCTDETAKLFQNMKVFVFFNVNHLKR